MARQKTISTGAINIRIHPHNQDRYVDLFKSAFRLKRPVNVRGDQFIIMRSLNREERQQYQPLRGELSRFTKIETDLPWLDIETLDVAGDEKLEELNIPENIYPNLVTFSFLFFPHKHLLIFESYSDSASLSPNIMLKYFEGLFVSSHITKKFGSVKIDIVADHTKLESIFKISELKHLTIQISKPNADHWDDELESDIEKRLDEQNVRTIKLEYSADEGGSIEPNDTTKKIARAALKNGYVEGRGRNENGISVLESTKDTPIKETQKYDPDKQSTSQAFIKNAYTLLSRITRTIF